MYMRWCKNECAEQGAIFAAAPVTMAAQMERQGILGAVPGDPQPSGCRIDDVPEVYARLLTEYIELLKTLDISAYMSLPWALLKSFDPRFQYRFWTSRYIRDFKRVPNAVRQELPYAAEILRSIQPLDDAQVRALVRCSVLNVGKLRNRFLFGGLNKLFVPLSAFVVFAKGLKEAFGVDLAVYVPYVSSIIYPAFIGLIIGLTINFIMFSDRIHMVRALDDIISIAAAARNLRQ